MTAVFTPRNTVVIAVLAILALVPVYCALAHSTFLLSLFTRIVIFALAAVALNLAMGFGGMNTHSRPSRGSTASAVRTATADGCGGDGVTSVAATGRS